MNIKKCDLCHKIIKKDDKTVIAGFGWIQGSELCEKCGKPVLDFLRKKKLIDSKKT